MMIDTASLRNAPLLISRPFELDFTSALNAYFFAQSCVNAQIDGELRRLDEDKDLFELKARLQCKPIIRCGRCLKPVSYPLDLEINEFFADTASDDAEASCDSEFIPIKDGLIDLDDILFTSVISALPMRIVCDDSCRGLCPRCGADLNVETCGCADETDPRFDALKSLFDEK